MRTRALLLLRAAAVGSITLVLAACARAPVRQMGGEAWGTTWSVQFVADEVRLAPLRAHLEAELARLAEQLSAWNPESALSRFNHAESGTWNVLPDDLFVVLEHALRLSRET